MQSYSKKGHQMQFTQAYQVLQIMKCLNLSNASAKTICIKVSFQPSNSLP